LPDNYVDPFYETFIGEVVPLYCFEDGLDNSDWSFTGSGNTWSFSPEPGSVDPTSSQEGSSQEGDGRWLGQSGDYPPQSNTRATSPRIDTQGFTNVRLQYWRWLTVEDGYFDRARIHANDQVVWSNHASDEDYLATFHHTDKQWRFHDVDLSATVANGSVEVGFELVSDFGLAFGGWNIDNLCVVGFGDPVACGNGRLDAGEQCDDGNQLAGDGCSSACVNESDPGGTTGDSGGDDGGDSDKGDDDGVDPDAPGFEGDGLIPRGCASCSSGPRGGPGPWGGFMAVGLLAWLRRRRA
jgi:MYXO-CTERM domain-containing protein